jgi:hypothetical protein
MALRSIALVPPGRDTCHAVVHRERAFELVPDQTDCICHALKLMTAAVVPTFVTGLNVGSYRAGSDQRHPSVRRDGRKLQRIALNKGPRQLLMIRIV